MPAVQRIITIRDRTVVSGDNRKTGLAPSWVFFKRLSDNADLAQPAISEIAQGQYKFAYDLLANGDAVGQIDAGATLASPSDRYIDVAFVGQELQSYQSLVHHAGTAQAGAATTLTLAAAASATSQLYKGALLILYAGTGAGQSRVISDYNGATKVATLGRAWAVNPDGTSQYAVLALALPKVDDNLAVTTAVAFTASGSAASNATATLNTDFTVGTSLYWKQPFSITGLDSTGWTALAWTLKRDAEEDTDDRALITVRLSNPGDAGDGLLVLHGQAATDATKAGLVLTGTNPDTVGYWELQAEALDLLPSPTSTPYTWELTRWTGAKKELIGTGKVTISRSVRRGVGVP